MLEKIEKWNYKDRQTLHHYPSSSIFFTEEIFHSLKKGYSQQIKSRLLFLKVREQERRSGVDGLTIEHSLRRLARRAGTQKEVHRGIATFIDHTFPPKQKKALFCLLADIEEAIPWKGLDINQDRKEYDKHQ